MSRTQKVATVSIGLVLVLVLAWMVMPRKSHEIVIKPVVMVQR
jgi:high-affinity Fe2+/Pb2+ permease